MLFSSVTFLFLFLPLVYSFYFFVKKSFKNYVLLFASLLFYAWGEPIYLIVMLFMIIINYFGALCIDRCSNNKYRKSFLFLTIFFDLGFLFYFKYFNFVMKNMNVLFDLNIKFLDIVMPIGISFYIFQTLSYVIDVYRGDVAIQKRIDKLALYICLFPQLIAGPIVKYNDIEDQIDNREESFDKFVYGVKRFIIGLSKKVLIANTMGAIVDKIFVLSVNDFGVLIAWVGAIAYSFQIFYDFSGYSDMAIGLGSMFGFKFLENFNYPYISRSITEFWRRWHISLSTWFKEYLYIPLGGNRVARYRMYFNLFLVFLATGVWHGAEWTFIVWGLWNGFFIIFEKLTGWYKKDGNIGVVVVQHLYTILLFVFGWVLFRAPNITYALQYLKNMLGLVSTHKIVYTFGYYVDNIEILVFVVAILCSMPIFKNITLPYVNKYKHLLVNIWIILLFILSVSSIAASTYNPFIYFRF